MSYAYLYSKADIQLVITVWLKGIPIFSNSQHYDPMIWRWDRCGKVIKFSEHGNANSEYGWEIDHIIPNIHGGDDYIENLQPLQWRNNRHKGISHPWHYECDKKRSKHFYYEDGTAINSKSFQVASMKGKP